MDEGMGARDRLHLIGLKYHPANFQKSKSSKVRIAFFLQKKQY
jgi:hypothetical protein